MDATARARTVTLESPHTRLHSRLVSNVGSCVAQRDFSPFLLRRRALPLTFCHSLGFLRFFSVSDEEEVRGNHVLRFCMLPPFVSIHVRVYGGGRCRFVPASCRHLWGIELRRFSFTRFCLELHSQASEDWTRDAACAAGANDPSYSLNYRLTPQAVASSHQRYSVPAHVVSDFSAEATSAILPGCLNSISTRARLHWRMLLSCQQQTSWRS